MRTSGRRGRESQPGHWQRRWGLSRLSFPLSPPLPSGPRLPPPTHRVQTPSLGRQVGLSDDDLVGDRERYGRPRRRCKPLAVGPRHSPRLRRQAGLRVPCVVGRAGHSAAGGGAAGVGARWAQGRAQCRAGRRTGDPTPALPSPRLAHARHPAPALSRCLRRGAHTLSRV